MIVYLVRHTSVVNPERRCYGQSEMELADDFDAMRAAISVALPDVVAACYTSPLLRCRRLSEALCAQRGIVPRTDDALKELDFGDWELRPWDDIGRQAIDDWAQDFVNNAPPGGESYALLNHRVLRFWRGLQGQDHEKPVLIVCHGGVIRALMAHTRGIPLADSFDLTIEPGAVVRIDTELRTCVTGGATPHARQNVG